MGWVVEYSTGKVLFLAVFAGKNVERRLVQLLLLRHQHLSSSGTYQSGWYETSSLSCPPTPHLWPRETRSNILLLGGVSFTHNAWCIILAEYTLPGEMDGRWEGQEEKGRSAKKSKKARTLKARKARRAKVVKRLMPETNQQNCRVSRDLEL